MHNIEILNTNQEINGYQLLSYDYTLNHAQNPKSHKGGFKWNTELLDIIPLTDDVNKEKIKQFLTPEKEITYRNVEELLENDPNTLITGMTLLTNNYNWIIEKITEERNKEQEEKEVLDILGPKFLFTKEEEITIFTGRALLTELNEDVEDIDIQNLIKKTDDIIILFNEGLIVKALIKKNCPVLEPDLHQQGRVGLLKALERYDARRGNKFSTYAMWWIEKEIEEYIAKNGSNIGHSTYMYQSIKKFMYYRNLLSNSGEKNVSNREIFDYCEKNGVKLVKKRENLLKAIKQRQHYSLEENIYGEEGSLSLINILHSDSQEIEEQILIKEKNQLLKKIIDNTELNEIEKFVIILRFGFTRNHPGEGKKYYYTLAQIGEKLDITRERVRQIEKDALKKLKRTGRQFQENY